MYSTLQIPMKYRMVVSRDCRKLDPIILSKLQVDEVLFSAKPPFPFSEWKEKYDTVDNDTDDTLEYNYRNIFHFRPELNAPGLTGHEVITIPHPLMLGIGLTVNMDRPDMLSFIPELLDELFGNPKTVFWTGTVMDLLFDGIPIDCTGENFATAAACSEFESGDYKSIQYYNETSFKFSLFGGVI